MVQSHFLDLVVPLIANRAMKIPKIDINKKLLPIVVMMVSVPKMYGPTVSPMLITVSYDATAVLVCSSGKLRETMLIVTGKTTPTPPPISVNSHPLPSIDPQR